MNQVEGRAYDILHKTTKRTGASGYHELAHTIVKDFYVDDCLTGADSGENCMDLRRELSEVNAAVGFHLCKFNSNSRAVIESIPEELRAKGVKSLNEKSVIPAGNVLDIYAAWKLWLSKLKEIHLVQVPRCYHPDLLSRSIIRQVESCKAACWNEIRCPSSLRTATSKSVQGGFWNDSKTVLAWIRSEAGRYKEFVANRVGEIQEATKGTDWRWVPTSENPADIGTRLETEISFEPTDMWYTGQGSKRQRLRNNFSDSDAKAWRRFLPAKLWRDKTQRKRPRLHRPLTRLLNLDDFSSLNRLVCRAAAVQKAARFWYKKIFHKSGELNPPWKAAMDNNKVRQHSFTVSPEEYRSAVRTMEGRPYYEQYEIVLAPTLQTCRQPQRSFTFTGLDAFGPFTVTVGRRHEKRWVIIFTCLVTRAIHLEVVHALSTDEFMMGLSRFIDTRGRPDTIYSDNRTNFVEASKDLKLAASEINFEVMAASGRFGPVKWKFNPPAAPHFGGAWERLIKSVKKCLRATPNEVNPKDTTLLTALKSAENIINSRPLTYVSSDPTEEDSLTSNHFLRGANDADPSIPKDYISKLMTRSKWHHQTEPIRTGDLVFLVDELHPKNMWKRGSISDVHFGPDGQVRVATITTKQNVKAVIYKRPVTKICPLGLRMELGERRGRFMKTSSINRDPEWEGSIKEFTEQNRMSYHPGSASTKQCDFIIQGQGKIPSRHSELNTVCQIIQALLAPNSATIYTRARGRFHQDIQSATLYVRSSRLC
ncbi:hypothetical protein LAZ67_13000957 [Cordylochernes scorpioides]|uniref:Integrase catalytic domain-containing protein n=1 Tax=Cordylochernes scorpioides TaxID=51811 RepID=A0ABY6L5A5_9ARAC|nr:hypothetical protein LAZ67_13000957 [Cordylochernes scorpioides]